MKNATSIKAGFGQLPRNEGNTERVVRTGIGIGLIIAGNRIVRGKIGLVMLGIGGVLVVTSALGYCPLYSLVGVSTYREEGSKEEEAVEEGVS